MNTVKIGYKDGRFATYYNIFETFISDGFLTLKRSTSGVLITGRITIEMKDILYIAHFDEELKSR